MVQTNAASAGRGAPDGQQRPASRPGDAPAFAPADTTDAAAARPSSDNGPALADDQAIAVQPLPFGGGAAPAPAAKVPGTISPADQDSAAAQPVSVPSPAPAPAGPNEAAMPIAPAPAPPARAGDDRAAAGLSGPLAGISLAPRPSRQDANLDPAAGPVSTDGIPSPNGGTPALAAGSAAATLPGDGNAASSDATPSFGTAIAAHVAAMAASGHQETTLQLQPPQLGELTVRVAVQGRDVSTWFSAPQPQVQLAVTQALDQLRSGLSDAGFNLAGAWVGSDGSAMPQRAFEQPLPSARRGGFTSVAAPAAPADAADPARAAAGVSVYV